MKACEKKIRRIWYTKSSKLNLSLFCVIVCQCLIHILNFVLFLYITLISFSFCVFVILWQTTIFFSLYYLFLNIHKFYVLYHYTPDNTLFLSQSSKNNNMYNCMRMKVRRCQYEIGKDAAVYAFFSFVTCMQFLRKLKSLKF